MGLLKKIGSLFSSNESSKGKEKTHERRTILVSNDLEYQKQAKRHTAINNELNHKKNELDALLNIKHTPSDNNRNESEEDIYAKNELKQKKAQSLIKTSFYKMLNQRQVLTNVINELIREHPERELEIIDMIIESEKEIIESDEIKKDLKLISQGKDPSVRNDPFKMSRMYDLGKSENKVLYDELFEDPFISKKK